MSVEANKRAIITPRSRALGFEAGASYGFGVKWFGREAIADILVSFVEKGLLIAAHSCNGARRLGRNGSIR